MDVTILKNQLHQTIEKVDDEQLLSELFQRISASGEKVDWWEELTEGQKNGVLESEQQYGSGEVVSNEAVMKTIQQWIEK